MSRQTPISKRTAVRQAIRRFLVGEDGADGAALVEFAVCAPLLVVMSIYTMDFGIYLFNNIAVQNAAQAGAHWAIANGIYNSIGIANAGANATGLASQITVTSTEFCGCLSTTGVTPQNTKAVLAPCANPPTPTPASCSGGATCPSGALAGNYVAVCAQRTYKPLAPFSGFVSFSSVPSNYSPTATSTVRVP